MGALLPGLRLEMGSETVEGLIVPVEVRAHGKINVRGIEFHVVLLVDQRLAVLVVVLGVWEVEEKVEVWMCSKKEPGTHSRSRLGCSCYVCLCVTPHVLCVDTP